MQRRTHETPYLPRPPERGRSGRGAPAELADRLWRRDPGGTAVDKSTLTIAIDSDSASFGFDPLRVSDAQRQFFEGLYENLMTLQPDGSAGPGLATGVQLQRRQHRTDPDPQGGRDLH